MDSFHLPIKEMQRSRSSEFPKNPLRMLTVEIVPRVSERSITEKIERTRWAQLGTKGDLERMRKRRV